ncbi:MAG: hypothetical protein M3151_06355 [Actinomycetota bacterium]|nr:hypothetical protein [Actinomycetota bacterium]
MVELADRAVEAAWKIRNLPDYDRRLERAARRLDELSEERSRPALVVYETALMKSGRGEEEVRGLVREFRDTFYDEEEPLTIPRASGIMNVEGDGWFFGDGELRLLTGRLLGQFQHRVAQYNYVDEREVLRRWADGYDTRLFVRRRIHETEPIIGVVRGLDLMLFQYLRVAAGGNTLVPTDNVALALEALGYGKGADAYETLAQAEGLALHLELPAPLVGELLEDIGREGFADFPEPPREAEPESSAEESPDAGVASEGGSIRGGAAAEEREQKPSPEDRSARRTAREDAARGEEPTRVQDPQAKDAPGVVQEGGDTKQASSPEGGAADAPGTTEREGET